VLLAIADMPRLAQLWNMDRGFVALPGQGSLLDLGKFEAVVLAAGDQTSAELTVLQTQSEPPACGPPLQP
jgi:hypothetical protein